MECLLLGGGERSRGDNGHLGVSLISVVLIAFGGTGDLKADSVCAGYREGVDVEDSAR